MSERSRDWFYFADEVRNHIDEYTVPQYGDKGEDQLTKYSSEDCFKQVEKYLNRRGRQQREGQDELDILKAAHYLQVGLMKMREEKKIIIDNTR